MSANVDEAALGFLLAVAAGALALISRSRPGFFIAFLANFYAALEETFPKFLKKSPRHSA